MKNIFDLSFKSGEWDGACFRVRKISPELQKEQDALTDQMIDITLNRRPRLYRTFGSCLLVLTGFGLLFGSTALKANNLAVAIPALAIGGCALVALALVTVMGGRKRLTAEEQEAKMKELDARIGQLNRRSLDALGVPADATEIDLLSKIYNPYAKKESDLFANGIASIFSENDALCVSDGEGVYAIPFSEITAVVRVPHAVMIDGWLKETPCDAAPYDTYGIAHMAEADHYRLPCYCAVRCTHNGEAFQMLVPEYDIDPILKMTGLSLTDEE